MPSESKAPAPQLRRMHPASLIFSVFAAARRWIIPSLLIWFGGRSQIEFIFAIFFIPSVLEAVIRYFNTGFALTEEELVFSHGVFMRNVRHIPFTRIQNIDHMENPIHRALGVVEARVQTAAGDEPEAILRVIDRKTLEDLQQHIHRNRTPAEPAIAPADEASPPSCSLHGGDAAQASPKRKLLATLTLPDLILFGFASNRGMVVIATVIGVIWQIGFFGESFNPARSIALQLDKIGPLSGSLTGAAATVLVIIALLFAVKLLSIAWAIYTLFDFRLTTFDTEVRSECGLVTRFMATIPLQRIQLLSITEGWMHRRTRRVSVRVETAGGGAGSEAQINRQWLVPLLRKRDLGALLDNVQPESRRAELAWQPVDQRGARRLFRRTLFSAFLFAAPLTWYAWPLGIVLLLCLGGWAWVHARLSIRHYRFATGPEVIAFRSGWWRRRMSFVTYSKVQTISLEQTPFDRHYGMAALRIDTAGSGPAGHRIRIPFLSQQVAQQLYRQIGEAVSKTRFQWR